MLLDYMEWQVYDSEISFCNTHRQNFTVLSMVVMMLHQEYTLAFTVYSNAKWVKITDITGRCNSYLRKTQTKSDMYMYLLHC